MNCASCREAVSARLDGEPSGLEAQAVDAHLQACPSCREYAHAAADLHRSIRIRPAEWGPDLTVRILARIGQDVHPAGSGQRDRRRDVRVALAVTAVVQLVLAVPVLLAGATGVPVHVARELASFDAALAVGFLVCAWQPARAFGLVPRVAALAAFQVWVAVLDVLAGRAPASAESLHLVDLVGLGLLLLLTGRQAWTRPHRLVVGR
jgi:predicted anti-sigma-YlaC factor YlaD